MSLKSVKTLSASQLAKKWNLSLGEVGKLIAQGAAVEKEHTKNEKEAREVARDHLAERPDYYKKLKKVEKSPISMKEGISAGPEREVDHTIGDLTGSSRKVMKVDEVKISPKIRKAAAVGMTAANIATGASVYDNASRGVGSPVRDIAAAASGLPGKVGYAAMGTNYTIKGFDKAREHLRAKVKQMKKDNDKKTVNEMSASSFANVRPSSNIIDRRPGLSPQGIRNTIDTFKQNMAMRQSGTLRQPEVGGANIPKQTPAQAAIGAARDAVRGMGQNVRDKLGLDLDKGPSTVARNVARTVAPASTAIAGAVADRMSANKPSVNLSKLPASKASPASIPTVGGASPPSLEGGATRQVRQSPTTRNSPAAPTTPQNATREGGIDIDALERDITSKTPSDSDVKFDQQIKKGRINEISAELVGKVSNARFFRGEAPSKVLTRAINKKFIESGKKDKGKINKDKKEVKEAVMAMPPQVQPPAIHGSQRAGVQRQVSRPTSVSGSASGRIAGQTGSMSARPNVKVSSGVQPSIERSWKTSGRGTMGTSGGSMSATPKVSTAYSQGGVNVGGKMAASKQTSPVVKGMTSAGREATAVVTKAAPTVAKGLGTVARIAGGPAATAAMAVMSPTAANAGEDEKKRQETLKSYNPYKSSGRSASDYEKQALTPQKYDKPETPKVDAPMAPKRPDYFSRGQAFQAARGEAGGSGGKFSYGGKEYQTNVAGEKYASKPKQTSVTDIKETKMDTKDLINEALDYILEENLVEMKENLKQALQEKAMEKLEERKKEIAANYFAE